MRTVNWVLIRAVLASVANTAIVPLQDVLGLGSEARMNLPGTVSGNWKWRYKAKSLTKEIRRKIIRPDTSVRPLKSPASSLHASAVG